MKWLKANKWLFVFGAVLWLVLVLVNPTTNPKTWGQQMTDRGGIICWTGGPGEGDVVFSLFRFIWSVRSEELKPRLGDSRR